MSRARVNYAKTLREGDAIVLPNKEPLTIVRIVNSAGRPAKVGKNIVLHTNDEPVRINTETPVRVIRKD